MNRRRETLTDWNVTLVGPLEDEGQLDDEVSSIQKYELAQRELVTSVVDYDLQSLASKVERGQILLDPSYQRRFRWDVTRQSQLIESFLMNVPVPPLFLNEDEYGRYSVIDGKQRLNAVHRFMTNDLRLAGLKVFREIEDQSFAELDDTLQTILVTRPTLRATIILRQSHPDIKFEVFRRLNTGGVRLNAQEIRNSVFPGPLNNLILELSEDESFHAMLGIVDKNTSAIYRTMRDCELVLRFFAFKDSWKSYAGGVAWTLDTYMQAHARAAKNALSKLRSDFAQTLLRVRDTFGMYAFRRYNPRSQRWGSAPLAALFDAEMIACYALGPRAWSSSGAERALDALFHNDEFVSSVVGATNSPRSLQRRIQMMIDALTVHV